MPDLILRHDPGSPFSEKVGLIMGFKDLAWRSVHIPVILPKPDVVALTGGDRKTPILQVGAGVYFVGLNADAVVLRRHDARAGTVHVHFPRAGQQIRIHGKEQT